MDTFKVRQVFMPYCLQRLKDGGYLLLNRRYKPLGVLSGEWVDYDSHPSKFRLKRALSDAQIANLDCAGRNNADCIYFYDDASVPTASDANWKAYSDRLAKLASYDIEF
jgi:hypothetical protein